MRSDPHFHLNSHRTLIITLKQELYWRTEVFPKKFVPQSSFVIGGIILKNSSINLKRRNVFSSQLIKMVSTRKTRDKLFLTKKQNKTKQKTNKQMFKVIQSLHAAATV